MRGRVSRRLPSIKVVLLFHRRLHGSQNHGKIFGQATGHNAIDGKQFNGGKRAARGQFTYDVARGIVGEAQHLGDEVFGRRDHGQAVGPAALIKKVVDLAHRVGNLDLFGGE